MYTIQINTDGSIVLTPSCAAGAVASAPAAAVSLVDTRSAADLEPAAESARHVARPALQPGEHYAGVVLDEQGRAQHHLVLLAAEPAGDLSWKDALAWAESVGGALPTRQEQSLLFGNCKGQFTGMAYWSSEQYSADYAWYQYFLSGGQFNILKSAELRARAVRRFAA